MKKTTVFALLIILSLTSFGAFDESIVEIQILYNDSTLKFKDVVDCIEQDGVILLPINSISPYIGAELNYNKVLDEFTVTSIDKEASYKISSKGYNLPDLTGKAPVLYGSDLYVHSLFLDLLLEAKSAYDSATVVFTIHLPIAKVTKTQNQNADQETFSEKEQNYYQIPYRKLSLSSISYRISQAIYKDQTKTTGDLRFNLRAGSSEITTGFGVKSRNWQKPTLQNPYFRLTREFANSLLVIGNTGFYSRTRLEEQPLFGLFYTTPYPSRQKAGVFKLDLEGDYGEKIKVFINNNLVKTVTIPEEGQLSTNVELIPNRLQTISIERKNSPPQILTVKNGLALMPPKSYNFEIYLGKFGSVDKEHGNLFELNFDAGLNSKTAFFSSIVWQKTSAVDNVNPNLRLEIQSEPFEAISTKYGVFISERSALGHELTLVASLPLMHWQLSYFSLPESIKNYWYKTPGRGLNFLVEGALTPNVSGQIETLASIRNKKTALRFYKGLLSYSLQSPRLRLEASYAHKETEVTETEFDLVENSITLGLSLKKPTYFFNSKYTNKHLALDTLSSKTTLLENKIAIGISQNIGASLESYLRKEGSLKQSALFSGSLQINLKPASIYSSLIYDTDLQPLQRTLSREFVLSVATRHNPRIGAEIKTVNCVYRGKYSLASSNFSYSYSSKNLLISVGLRNADNSLDLTWQAIWNSEYNNGLNLSLNLERLPKGSGRINEYRAGVSLSQGLAFTENGIISTPYTSSVLSTLSGRVFLDLNNNGVYDQGEPGLQDIELQLDSRFVKSNPDGSFLFSNVKEGVYTFGFDPQKLDSDYTTDLLNFPVKINKGDNLVFDMPLTINGILKGRVYIDVDSDGTFSEEDTPLDWTQVIVSNGQKAFTDKNGSYYFENLPLGTFEITVAKDTLPVGLNAPETITIQITPDKLNNLIDFALRY
ncbi:MAG: SdrD B-like domain-containing protein [Firmicutes bacterium]|nr:SdrD B-like domain-containing protein [Bacillota bacterium]